MRALYYPILALASLVLLAAGPAPAPAQDGGAGQGGEDPGGSSNDDGSAGDDDSGSSATSDAPPGHTASPVTGELPRERGRRVQERLATAGFDPGPVDGTMGARTRAALRAFQEERGLDPTGEPNEATLTELGVE
jgi:membrane fusion protein, multidrug efflux system